MIKTFGLMMATVVALIVLWILDITVQPPLYIKVAVGFLIGSIASILIRWWERSIDASREYLVMRDEHREQVKRIRKELDR